MSASLACRRHTLFLSPFQAINFAAERVRHSGLSLDRSSLLCRELTGLACAHSAAGFGGHTTKDFGQFSKTAGVPGDTTGATKPFTADAVRGRAFVSVNRGVEVGGQQLSLAAIEACASLARAAQPTTAAAGDAKACRRAPVAIAGGVNLVPVRANGCAVSRLPVSCGFR